MNDPTPILIDPSDIPKRIRHAAHALDYYFKTQGINEWALMGIQSRRSEPEPVHNSDGMINKLAMELVGELQMIPADESYEKCKEYLRKAATTERAARDRADLMATECIERITKVAYAAESTLAALKAELVDAVKSRDHCHDGFVTQSWLCGKAEKERDALKLKLEVAKTALDEIETELTAYRSGAPENRLTVSIALDKATEALAQLNESEEKK